MEKILTKYFWVLNLVTLAAVAILLADGTSEIIATKISGLFPTIEQPTTPIRAIPRSRNRWSSPNGSAILDRNIFDSTYGPVSDVVEDPVETMGPEPIEGDLPIVPCTETSIKLLATVASRYDISWSFASITEGSESRLCRVGDELDNRVVSGITWRYLFLMGTSDECYIDLFGDQKNVKNKPKRPKRAAKTKTKKDDLKNGIQSVSDTEKVVDRALVDSMLSDPTKFVRSVRVRPHKQNGKVVGFKLRRFRADSPLALLGAKRGDIIHSVNGKDLTSVDKALGAYQGLRSANDLTFSITRGGKPMDIHVGIR
ncbi:MAG: hypothetical protein GY854_27010 [Deltaproteobacteria bacterium]|nr:hypothetical protein [Deltaproteobacteria bacterium]